MKTLVIHPTDPTTDFLKDIYADKDWTRMTNPYNSELEAQINAHDRIVMLGHGTNMGLLTITGNYMISSRHVYLLRNKINICVWCNANEFVKRYALSGFYTGMIVSELDEAAMFSLPYKGINESNALFASALKAATHKVDAHEILASVRELYVEEDNAIIDFNKDNLFAI